MKRLFSSLMLMTVSVIVAQAAKNPADYYRGQQGGVSPAVVEALQKDIPMAKRVLAECRSSAEVMERRSCALMVMHIESPELAEGLRPYLKDKEPDVRREAAQSLYFVAKDRAYDWILPLVDDPDRFTRISVMGKAHELGGKKMHPKLRQTMLDSDPETALFAARLLARDGEGIPREFALAYASSAALKTNGAIASNRSALLLLAHVGDERDFPLLETIYSRREGLRWDRCASPAMFARQMIRLRLAKTDRERAVVMDDMLRDGTIQPQVFEELTIRHERGDKSVLRAIEKAAADRSNPEWPRAKSWLEWIDRTP